ncbi:MAG: hypothetical protein EXR10_05015 [Alphaproteobacteria bacterium]|nr:hypothetical protein [Alphaproteobacteria bacterium]
MSQDKKSQPAVASWYQPPFVGLSAVVAVLFGIAMGHTILVLMRHMLDADEAIRLSEVIVSLAMGSLGFYMVWNARTTGEAVGSWTGFIAGTLIWVGFFELGWKVFARALNPQPVMFESVPVLNAELQVIEASTVAFLMLMAFLTINKETRCNLMMWIRNKLGMEAGAAVTGKERNFAAVTAMESIATTWACYIITILLVDPRIIGNPMTMTAQLPWLVIFVWGIYLIYRLTKQKHMAPALRYAIGTGNVNWIWIEAGSRAELYEEVWIKPVQYPVMMSLVFATLVALLIVMHQNKGSRGGTPIVCTAATP